MDTKLKKYSHSIITKLIVFIIMLACFSGVMQAIAHLVSVNDGHVEIVFEENYFLSKSYVRESESLISDLTRLLGEYKNKENILKGGTIDKDELKMEEQNLFSDYQYESKSYNPNLSEAENYERFKVDYADKIDQIKDQMIKRDIKEFHFLMNNIEEVKDPLYYASDGVNVYTNSTMKDKQQVKAYPSYMVFEGYKSDVYPKEVEKNKYLNWITMQMDEMGSENHAIYVSFSKEFLDSKISEWKENKVNATKGFYRLLGFSAGFILSFFYLVLVIGRKSFKGVELHLHAVDKLYIDINILLCIGLVTIWLILLDLLMIPHNISWVIPISIPFSAAFLVLTLSIVRHFKNRTLFKHTLIFQVIKVLVRFAKNVYDSGNVGVKTVLIVIGYPLLIALTFFMFPITIGFAAWFALKKVKSFKAIKDGVERIKNGEIHHTIDIDGKGEFASLAANINSLTDGLKNAVDNELKSERLKTELITNVSHDIRTPLTSIITYVDLLKSEKVPPKAAEYIDILDQKSKRLKLLTDDLFEAAKATSGNISVDFEKIDLVSLLTQGLGEVNDRIEASNLQFKLNQPADKVYIKADGKLLWRSIENLLSNIFKYALNGSRVYIDVEDAGSEILLTFKNISAFELNISADELMERFKRGDDSRSSQGSGLGLSIAKSLIEVQKGTFNIYVDGDLFKAVITFPKMTDTELQDVREN